MILLKLLLSMFPLISFSAANQETLEEYNNWMKLQYEMQGDPSSLPTYIKVYPRVEICLNKLVMKIKKAQSSKTREGQNIYAEGLHKTPNLISVFCFSSSNSVSEDDVGTTQV